MEIELFTYREAALADTDVISYQVEARDGTLGKVDDASYETGAGYLVIDTSSWSNLGFGKKSLIPAAAVERVDHTAGKVFLSLTKEQVKDAPEFHTFDGPYRERIAGYYGPFLMAPDMVAPSTAPVDRR